MIKCECFIGSWVEETFANIFIRADECDFANNRLKLLSAGPPGSEILETYLMIRTWDIDGDELSKIIFPESGGNALLQRVVVGDDVSNICE